MSVLTAKLADYVKQKPFYKKKKKKAKILPKSIQNPEFSRCLMIQSLCKFLLWFLTGAVMGHHCVVGLLLGLYTFFYLEQNSTGEE